MTSVQILKEKEVFFLLGFLNCENKVLRLLADMYINTYCLFSVEEEEARSELKIEPVWGRGMNTKRLDPAMPGILGCKIPKKKRDEFPFHLSYLEMGFINLYPKSPDY